MNSLPLVLYLMLLLDSECITCQLVHTVLSSLPAPVNVHVTSDNFRHVLHWDPGPGTPPGTQYKISRRVNGKKEKRPQYSTTTSFKLKLHNLKTYYLTVQASRNHTLSPESLEFTFTPYKDTKIGPPILSLAGCGNCIQVNITLPEADRSSGIDDIQKFYGAQFIVYWRKHKEAQVSCETQNKSFTLNNLENGREYCVWVHMKIRLNNYTAPSSYYCILTSTVEPSRGPIFFGAAAAFLILIFAMMTFMFCLYISGFLKATLPRALIVALSQGYTLTPERTIPDQISLNKQATLPQRKRTSDTMPQPATRGTNWEEYENEDEKEEKQGINIYIDRDVEVVSAESSCQTSDDLMGNSTGAASQDSGSLTVEILDKEFVVKSAHGRLDQDDAKTEGPEVSVISERCKTGFLGHTTGEMKEKVSESSGNVNLLSVTLAALARCEQEEEEEQNIGDTLTEFFKLSSLEPVLLSDSKQSHTDSQTDHQATVTFVLLSQEDFISTGYESRRADTLAGCLKTCDGEETQGEKEEDFVVYNT